MNKDKKFEVRFAKEAIKEYENLDNSVLELVNKSIDELEFRADEVGKKLENNSHTKLAGCMEIKLRSAGIRIIFRVTNYVIDILRVVYIVAIQKRSNNYAFNVSSDRIKKIKGKESIKIRDFLSKEKKWVKRKNKKS